MARIRSRDTKPELIVRRLLHRMGYRFRLHREDLPGKPDIVLPARRTAVFVHGCFWHQHPDPSCKRAKQPKSRTEYWLPKLARNAQRDVCNKQALEAAGWRVVEIWECQVSRPSQLEQFLAASMTTSNP